MPSATDSDIDPAVEETPQPKAPAPPETPEPEPEAETEQAPAGPPPIMPTGSGKPGDVAKSFGAAGFGAPSKDYKGPPLPAPVTELPATGSPEPDERTGRYHDAYAKADQQFQAEWQAQNPLKSSRETPPTPTDLYAQAERQSDADLRQQQEQAAADQRAQLGAENDQREAQMRGTGQKYYKDSQGRLQPVIDPESGRPLFNESTWQVAQHPRTGATVLMKTDKYGQRQFKQPQLVSNPDPTDPNLYYRLPDGTQQIAGKAEDLVKSPDFQTARMAKRVLAQRRAAEWKQAIAPMEGIAADTAAQFEQAQEQHATLQQQSQALDDQINNLIANPQLQETTGGILGIGAHPSDAAMEAQKQLSALQDQKQQIEAQRQKLEESIKPGGDLFTAQRRAKLNLNIFKAKAQHDSYADLAEERREILKQQGGDPATDPTLQSILQAQQTFKDSIGHFTNVAQKQATADQEAAQRRSQNVPPVVPGAQEGQPPVSPGSGPTPAPALPSAPANLAPQPPGAAPAGKTLPGTQSTGGPPPKIPPGQTTTAAAAFGRAAGTSLIPLAASVYGFDVAAAAAAPLTAQTRGVAPLVSGLIGAGIVSYLAEKGQDKVAAKVAPKLSAELKKYSAIDAAQHPVAVAAGNFVAAAANFKLNPMGVVRGAEGLFKAAVGQVLNSAEKEAALHLIKQSGLGALLGIVDPLAHGQMPTLSGVTQSVAQMIVFGNSRHGAKAAVQHIDNMFPDLFWKNAGITAEEFAKTYPDTVRRVAANQGTPEDVAFVQRVNAAAAKAGVRPGDLARGRTVAEIFDSTPRATQKVIPPTLRPADRSAGSVTFQAGPNARPGQPSPTAPAPAAPAGAPGALPAEPASGGDQADHELASSIKDTREAAIRSGKPAEEVARMSDNEVQDHVTQHTGHVAEAAEAISQLPPPVPTKKEATNENANANEATGPLRSGQKDQAGRAGNGGTGPGAGETASAVVRGSESEPVAGSPSVHPEAQDSANGAPRETRGAPRADDVAPQRDVGVERAPQDGESVGGSQPGRGYGGRLATEDVSKLGPKEFNEYGRSLNKKEPGGFTAEAHRIGEAAEGKPEELDKLKAAKTQADAELDKAIASGDLEAANGHAQKVHFFSEAIGAATGTGSAGEHVAKKKEGGLVEQYMKSKDTNFGLHVTPDKARPMIPGYDPKNPTATHDKASAVADAVWAKHLKDPKIPGLTILGGGGGSGKTAALDHAKKTGDAVYDGVFASKGSLKRLDEAVATGKPVTVIYTHRGIMDAITGMIQRANKPDATQPIVPHDVIARGHFQSARNFVEAAEKYKDNPNVHFRAIDNSGAIADIKMVGNALEFVKNIVASRPSLSELTDQARNHPGVETLSPDQRATYLGTTSGLHNAGNGAGTKEGGADGAGKGGGESEHLTDERRAPEGTGERGGGGAGGNELPGQRNPSPGESDRGNGQHVPVAAAQGELAPAAPGAEPAGQPASERLRDRGSSAPGQGGGGVEEPAAGAPAEGAGSGNDVEPEREGRPSQSARAARAEIAPEDQNHHIEPSDTIAPSGDKTKARANLAALKLLKQLEAEKRNPTPEEKKVLAQYVGYGGLPNVFNEGAARLREMSQSGRYLSPDQVQELASFEKEWGKLYDETKAAMTKEERAAAARSTLNAHYTAKEVIEPMWDVVKHLGFKGGTALETSAGVGHFLGLEPKDLMAKTRWKAVELDSVSGRILTKLYPQAETQVKGFQDAKIAPHSVDLVIGNVPFAKDGPMDSRYPRMSLHNYFFARSMDALKPGGLMVAITSSSTMDSPASKAAREWLAERGDLVGAIRLPNNAFKKNAGTEVTTDIVILRKRGGGAFSEAQPWINTQEIPAHGSDRTVAVNEYFARNPDMMLGHMGLEGSMYGPDQPALTAIPGKDLADQIREAMARLPANVMGRQAAEKAPEVGAEGELSTAKEGSVVVKDGKPYQVENGALKSPPWANTPAKAKLATSYAALRDHLKETLARMQTEGASDAAIAADRAKLNKLYDAHRAKFGAINDRGHNFLEDDPELPLAQALEEVTTAPKDVAIKSGKQVGQIRSGFEKVFKKAAIFDKRTIFPRSEPTSADTVTDAIAQSLAYRNAIDPAYVAELRGITEEQARKELAAEPTIFTDPKTGAFEPADAYLSGFVREKLEQAKAAAKEDPAYKKNVEALEKAQPPWLGIHDISLKLGSSWLPPDLIQGFLRDKLKVGAAVHFVPQTVHWKVDPRSGVHAAQNVATYGTTRMKGHELVEDALNLKTPIVYDEVPNGEGGVTRVRNNQETVIAQQKQAEIQQLFKDYVKEHEEHHQNLESIYNNKFNGVTLREFTGPPWDHYPDASHEYKLRQHQKDVVHRILQESTLLAHSVGTGKTFVMCTAAMEMRRLGLAKKPMIVTQNATTQQFAADFKRLYPTAKVLVPTRKQREAGNRQRLMSRIATGDYDAVVIPQSFLNELPDSPERVASFIQSEIEELEEAMISAKQSEGQRSPKVKDLEKAKKRLEEKLKKLADRKTDNAVTFEQLGVDALMVDEAHNYKKLEFTSQMDNIKGLDRSASQRGLGLYMKTRWVQDKNNGKNVVLATGTPVSNTIAEAWNMLRFTRPDLLKKYHVEKFDDFASTFGDTVTNIEQTAGGGFKSVTRFAKYSNGPELIKMFHSGADVVLKEDVNLPNLPAVKNGQPTTVEVNQTPMVGQFIRVLRDRLAAFDRMSGRQKRENSHIPLVTFGEAKKATLDLRLIDPAMPDEPGSKINEAAKRIAQVYKDSAGVKGTQMVFADLFQSPDGAFNLYHEIRRKLGELGVPPEQVAIIGEAKNDAQRERIFAAVKAGDIRVILGSTEKMGTGVNVQDKLVALHHLDAPARPMDIEQRNGRIVRQGNENAEVEIFNYGVKNTLDATLYQRLAIKQKFINQIMRGDVSGRSFEDAADDVSMTFEEQMAAFSGNPLAMKRVGAEGEVRRLEALKQGHIRQMEATRANLSSTKGQIESKESLQPKLEAAAAQMAKDIEGEPHGKVGGKAYADKKTLVDALDTHLKETLNEKRAEAGSNIELHGFRFDAGTVELFGHPVRLTLNIPTNQHGIVGEGARSPYFQYNSELANGVQMNGEVGSGSGLLTSFLHQAKSLADKATNNQADIERLKRDVTEMTGFLKQPFAQADALASARAEVVAIDKALEDTSKAAEALAETDEHKEPIHPAFQKALAAADRQLSPQEQADAEKAKAMALPLNVPQMKLSMDIKSLREPQRDRLRRLAEQIQAKIDHLESPSQNETHAQSRINEARVENLEKVAKQIEMRLRQLEQAGLATARSEGDLLAPDRAQPAREDIIDRLRKLKMLDRPGQLNMANPVGLAWDLAIDAAILGVRAGRTAQQVVAAAMGVFHEKFPGAAREERRRLQRALQKTVDRLDELRDAGSEYGRKLMGEVARNPKFTSLKQAINRFEGMRQAGNMFIRDKLIPMITEAVPSVEAREAINAWLEAGGSKKQLQEWADGSRANPKTKAYAARYERALKLTPAELAVAKKIEAHYAAKLKQGQKEGFLSEGVQNFVNHMWEVDDKGEKFANEHAPQLTQFFRSAMKRSFPSSYEGEQAGMKPRTYDIAEVVGAYTDGFNRISESLKLIKDLTTKKAADGRPLAFPSGMFKEITGDDDSNGLVLINPGAKPKEMKGYRTMDHPALNKFKWAGELDGKPVMLRGQLALHPDAYAPIKNLLSDSAIRDWWKSDGTAVGAIPKAFVRFADSLNSIVKGTALGFLSPFHQVQEGTHAIGHRVNPLSVPVIDPETNPRQLYAMTHGLMLGPGSKGQAEFMQGLADNHNPLYRIPGAGQMAKAYTDYLFQQYIPGLKMQTWEAMVKRNTELYKGKLSADDIAYLSAIQANNAYGHLNYADLGRNPTLQHFLHWLALAPDFLEGRARFVGEALQGAVSKAGREQLHALLFLAALFYASARIMNALLNDGDSHPEQPFGVVHGNRLYTMRSVPEDLYRMFKDTRMFWYNRLSPLLRGVIESATGRNARGEKVHFTDAFKDLAVRAIPSMASPVPGIRNLSEYGENQTISPFEQFLGNLGIQVKRLSPTADAYALAGKYKTAHGDKEDTGSYPVSKYQQLRYALEDADMKKAAAEGEKQVQTEMKTHPGMTRTTALEKVRKGFEESLFHPYTGTEKEDKAFRLALPPKDLATVQKADLQRTRTWIQFCRILGVSSKRTTRETKN